MNLKTGAAIFGGFILAGISLITGLFVSKKKFKRSRSVSFGGKICEDESKRNHPSYTSLSAKSNTPKKQRSHSTSLFVKSKNAHVPLEDLIEDTMQPLQVMSDSFECNPDEINLSSSAVESLLGFKNLLYDTITKIDRLFLFYKKGVDFEVSGSDDEFNSYNRNGDLTLDFDSDDFMSIPDAYQQWSFIQDPYHKEHHVRMFQECIDKYCDIDFYLECATIYSTSPVQVRSIRTKFTHADNDIDYIIKILALRKGFEIVLQTNKNRKFLLETCIEMFSRLIKISGKNSTQFKSALDNFVEYALNPINFDSIMKELEERNVHNYSVYDFVIDFIFVDALSDLELIPSSILSVLNNRWLSRSIKENSVNTLVWSYIKAKSQVLENKTGILSKYYNVCFITSPLLAWGLLGEKGTPLNLACNVFKTEFLSYLRSIFNVEKADYKTVEGLANSIMDISVSTAKRAFSQLETIENAIDSFKINDSQH